MAKVTTRPRFECINMKYNVTNALLCSHLYLIVVIIIEDPERRSLSLSHCSSLYVSTFQQHTAWEMKRRDIYSILHVSKWMYFWKEEVNDSMIYMEAY